MRRVNEEDESSGQFLGTCRALETPACVSSVRQGTILVDIEQCNQILSGQQDFKKSP